MPTVAQLIHALPAQEVESAVTGDWSFATNAMSMRPVPLGRVRRIGLLGTLQAKIAAAYLFYWIRGWFSNAEEKEKSLAETRWRTAARLFDSMGYLRGAVMKIGQTLGNYPDIAPNEFVQTLEGLHFNAPPMHWSLLREMVHSELGRAPETVFTVFDERAFAAASFGQVHGATLAKGEEVAVKIQYPGIARAVREDFRNFFLFLLPARLSADWENTRQQFEDLRTRIEEETDYEREARMLQRARSLFREDDGIVVPQVSAEYSTARVLTMKRLRGVHIDEFMATNPSQNLRNEYARRMIRAWYRMLFAGRLLYVDLHPGNFLFMDDGRLGVIDFGCMMELDDGMWDLFRRMDRAMTTGRREDIVAAVKEWSSTGNDPADDDRVRLMADFAEWSWGARFRSGEFDFGNEADFRRGIDLFIEMVRKRYSRARACTPIMTRQQMGLRAMLYRLKANIDVAPIAEEEVRATGWDRSDYATR